MHGWWCCCDAVQLLGFPVQLLGLFTIPLLVVRWGMDGVKPGDDMEKYTVSSGVWCWWVFSVWGSTEWATVCSSASCIWCPAG
jgi:hypothetical protein